MLLGSTSSKETSPADESLIIQLLLQHRYAQVYELLLKQQSTTTSALYNMALCLHWAGNYQEALNRLESIRLGTNINTSTKPNSDSNYKTIISRQNQTDDYLQGMTEAFIKNFPDLATDSIIRLKTDCWLQLGNFAKVIAIATPIAHKGYRNITDALKLANNERI